MLRRTDWHYGIGDRWLEWWRTHVVQWMTVGGFVKSLIGKRRISPKVKRKGWNQKLFHSLLRHDYKKIITELILAASNLLGTIRVFHQRVSHLPIVDDSVAELRRPGEIRSMTTARRETSQAARLTLLMNHKCTTSTPGITRCVCVGALCVWEKKSKLIITAVVGKQVNSSNRTYTLRARYC
jgi:hypothetical protein